MQGRQLVVQQGVLADGCGSSRRLLEEINSQRGRTDGGRVRMRLVQACGLMRVWVEIIYVERVTGGSSLPHPRLAYARPREEHQPSGPPTVTALSAPSTLTMTPDAMEEGDTSRVDFCTLGMFIIGTCYIYKVTLLSIPQ